MNLKMSQTAFEEMKKECLTYAMVETGGILIGRLVGDEIIVPFSIGSGLEAVRTPFSYEPDVDWQQKMLDGLFDKFKLNYVGSYHKHPHYMTYPSRIDYVAAMHILSSSDWGVSQIIFPIVVSNGHEILVYPYYISRNAKAFRLIPMNVIPDNEFSELEAEIRIGASGNE